MWIFIGGILILVLDMNSHRIHATFLPCKKNSHPYFNFYFHHNIPLQNLKVKTEVESRDLKQS